MVLKRLSSQHKKHASIALQEACDSHLKKAKQNDEFMGTDSAFFLQFTITRVSIFAGSKGHPSWFVL